MSTLLERVISVSARIADLEEKLAAELQAWAAACRDAGLRDPLAGLSDPFVNWEEINDLEVPFTLRDPEWDSVTVRLPTAWFSSGAAGVEHERARLAELDRKELDRRRADQQRELDRLDQRRATVKAWLDEH